MMHIGKGPAEENARKARLEKRFVFSAKELRARLLLQGYAPESSLGAVSSPRHNGQ